MDVLGIIDMNLENFKILDRDKLEDLELSQFCAICLATTETFSLNSLVFQYQSLQDIFTNTTSCFNSKKLWKTSERSISSCRVCLQQLLASHLFQKKAQKAYELLKTTFDVSVKEENTVDETESDKYAETEVVMEPEYVEVKPDLDETHHTDNSFENLNSGFCENVDKYDNEYVTNETVPQDASKIIIEKVSKGRPVLVSKQCQICLKEFRRPCDLRDHMFAIHKQEARHECKVCKKRFNWRKSLERHTLLHTGEKPFSCGVCGKGFIQKIQLVDHEVEHTGQQLACELCGKVSKTVSAFNRHIKNVHTENTNSFSATNKITAGVICQVCGKELSAKSALYSHMLTHGEKQFACEFCDKKFTSKVLKLSHERIHTGEKPYACKDCEKTFRSLSELSQHALIHTGKKPHACHLCPKTFRQSQHLKYHIKAHSGLKNFSCDVCGKYFLTNGNLTAHKKVHLEVKEFVCEICNKGFSLSSTLKKHKRLHQQNVTSEIS